MKALAGRAAEVLARSGLLGLLESADRDDGRVRIVAYHRVDHPEAEPDLHPGLLSATPAEFREQVETLATHYHPIGIDELVAAHRGEHRLPRRAVLLSFDDGYRDFAEHAWPILGELGVPAVLFVPTAFPDMTGPGFWWDRLHAALRRTTEHAIDIDGLGRFALDDTTKRRATHRAIREHVKAMPHEPAMRWLETQLDELAELPSLHRVLSWDALRSMARDGLAVCSHSHVHALCTQLEPTALANDLRISRAILERELGDDAAAPVFAYPSGACDATSRAAVRDAGYELAFGGSRRIERLPFDDPHQVHRLPTLRYATALFRAQLRPSVAGLGRILIDGRGQRGARARSGSS
jgi:peptidoglycan/xylan/chitin deacetylase (PgdA/CDA1 family)